MPTKKTATKRAPAKRTVPAKTAPAKKGSRFSGISKIAPKKLLIPAIIVAAFLLIGFSRNFFVAAIVNGEQISRLELLSTLEELEGQRVLQSLVTQKLIEQEAEKRGLTVSGEEIDAELAKIEESVSAQGQNLDDLLAIQNFTRDQLKEQLENQLLLQKMVNEKSTEVTDEEVDKYLDQNEGSIPEGTDEAQLRSSVKEQLKQQKMNTEVQNLLTKLQSDANIDILLNK